MAKESNKKPKQVTKTSEKQQSLKKEPHRWKPGECPNPNGRPRKGESITEIMKDYAENKKLVEDGEEITYKEMLVKRTFQLADKHDLPAIKYAKDVIDGTMAQNINIKAAIMPVDPLEIEQIEKQLSEFFSININKENDANRDS
jgi:hypothetical protein